MTEGALTLRRSSNSTALAVVVLMHGAAITALALSKMEVIENPLKVLKLIPIAPPKEPPPPVKPIKPQPKMQHQTVTVTPPEVPTIDKPVFVETLPLPPVPLRIDIPGPVTIDPPRSLPLDPPAAKKVQPARAKANLSSYVSNDDYPASAQRDGQQGTTRFKLGVDPNGRVSSCTVTQSSGSSALDAATCKLMKQRARFNPAHDDLGRATPDQVASAIRWVLPEA